VPYGTNEKDENLLDELTDLDFADWNKYSEIFP